MVMDAKLLLDHLSHPFLRPLFVRKASRLCARFQLLDQSLFLPLIQTRRSSRRFPLPQRLYAACFQFLLPAADNRSAHAQLAGDPRLLHLTGLQKSHCLLPPLRHLVSG